MSEPDDYRFGARNCRVCGREVQGGACECVVREGRMSLHNEKPSTERLDKHARKVLVSAVRFERAVHEASRYGGTEDVGKELCAAVAEYREAMLAELVGTEPTLGG